MRSYADRRGSNAIEFAMLLPVLMAIVSAIVDYGWYYSEELAVIASAREGARAGAVTPMPDACAAAITRARAALIDAGLDGDRALLRATTRGAAPDQVLTVTAEVPFVKLLGLVPTPGRLRAATTMRVEDQLAATNCSR
jgi:Flp pilus assembly protein TadG